MKSFRMSPRAVQVFTGGAALGLAGLSQAAIDTTAILSTVADIVTAAAAVGAAVLAMHYGIKAYKWLRAAG